MIAYGEQLDIKDTGSILHHILYLENPVLPRSALGSAAEPRGCRGKRIRGSVFENKPTRLIKKGSGYMLRNGII